MHRQRKSRWEFATVFAAIVFFMICVASAGWAASPTGAVAVMSTVAESIQETPSPSPSQEPAQVEEETLIKSMDWDAEETEILLRIAMAEAEGEDTEGKALVMLVVLNRVWSDGFPNTIEGVVFQTLGGYYQFSPVAPGGRYWTRTPNEDCMEALRLIESGWDGSQGALYFEACTGSSWQSENCEFLFKHGNHSFYK